MSEEYRYRHRSGPRPPSAAEVALPNLEERLQPLEERCQLLTGLLTTVAQALYYPKESEASAGSYADFGARRHRL